MRNRPATLAPETGEITIGVGLGERSYDIVIGRQLLDGAGARIAATLPARAAWWSAMLRSPRSISIA